MFALLFAETAIVVDDAKIAGHCEEPVKAP
jgi:hypothetical protein